MVDFTLFVSYLQHCRLDFLLAQERLCAPRYGMQDHTNTTKKPFISSRQIQWCLVAGIGLCDTCGPILVQIFACVEDYKCSKGWFIQFISCWSFMREVEVLVVHFVPYLGAHNISWVKEHPHNSFEGLKVNRWGLSRPPKTPRSCCAQLPISPFSVCHPGRVVWCEDLVWTIF